MGRALHPSALSPLTRTLATLGNAAAVKAGTVAIVTDYGGTIAVSDGVRWRLERLYSTWANKPAANLVPVGTELSVTDCAGAIAVANAAGWLFRPIEIYNSATAILINGASGSGDQVAHQFTLPANILGNKGTLSTEFCGTFSVASANAKTTKLQIGSTVISQLAWNSVHKTFSALGRFRNVTKQSQQGMDGNIFTYGGSGGGINTAAVDTSVDTTIKITQAMANTSET